MSECDHDGWRERKKRQTRRAIHAAAVELAIEHGGASGVTVEEVATRAGVAPRTFFNYFATKEAALLGNDPDAPAAAAAAVRARPAGEDPLTAVWTVVEGHLASLQEDREAWLARRRLFEASPELMSAMLGKNFDMEKALVEAVRERLGASVADALPSIVVAAVLGAARAAMLRYQNDPSTPLRTCLDEAAAVLRQHWRA